MHCYSYINVNENLMVLCVTTNLTLTYLSPFTLPPLYLPNIIIQEYFISSAMYPTPSPSPPTLPPFASSLPSQYNHTGVFHILCNISIQLRVGGYLNLVYGNTKWLTIYIFSGIFGELLSCCVMVLLTPLLFVSFPLRLYVCLFVCLYFL